MKKQRDGFEQREEVATFGYWKDPRWKIVTQLRKEGKNANGLVMEIRDSWGVEL